jgi:hypothetical protein
MTDLQRTANERDRLRRVLRGLEPIDPRQVAIWRAMSGARRLDIACQAYQMVLDIVRLTERQRHPDLSDEELAWQVPRRMQGDLILGR